MRAQAPSFVSLSLENLPDDGTFVPVSYSAAFPIGAASKVNQPSAGVVDSQSVKSTAVLGAEERGIE